MKQIDNQQFSEAQLNAELQAMSDLEHFSVSALERRILAQAEATPQLSTTSATANGSTSENVYAWWNRTITRWTATGMVAATLLVTSWIWLPHSETNGDNQAELSELDLEMHEYWLLEDQLVFASLD